ncbi:MAG: hypothetical protein DHS20C14_13250 [Phycisphaeraceae bacterium]|nr:MAG: hypothetical protein DHS20C14_13250 [Phycisphaeraceae bacterium]
MSNKTTIMGAAAIATICGSAMGSITITQGSSAATYGTTLNFDEVGGPTGAVATNAFASFGVTELQAGDSAPFVGDFSTTPGQSWLGTGNAFFGNFGVFMTMDSDLSEMSFQAWDPSGAPSPFGGGMGIFVFDDGVEVANAFVTPAWGGIGDTWFDITTSGGMVFDEVRILGFGFGPTTYADNFSWTAIPAPGSFALLGLAGVAVRRRRA